MLHTFVAGIFCACLRIKIKWDSSRLYSHRGFVSQTFVASNFQLGFIVFAKYHLFDIASGLFCIFSIITAIPQLLASRYCLCSAIERVIVL